MSVSTETVRTVLKQEYPETPFTRAVASGFVDEKAVRAGLAVRTGEKHPTLDMVKGYMLPSTTPHLEHVREVLEQRAAPRCTVDGVEATELALIVKPCAFFVTTANGTHEINRCYFQNDTFKYGVDMERIGGCRTLRVEYLTDRGLYIHFDKGYEMCIPFTQCQGSWRVAE